MKTFILNLLPILNLGTIILIVKALYFFRVETMYAIMIWILYATIEVLWIASRLERN